MGRDFWAGEWTTWDLLTFVIWFLIADPIGWFCCLLPLLGLVIFAIRWYWLKRVASHV